jgi:hypothetical protein
MPPWVPLIHSSEKDSDVNFRCISKLGSGFVPKSTFMLQHIRVGRSRSFVKERLEFQ